MLAVQSVGPVPIWLIGAVANLAISVSYFVILGFMLMPLIRERQLLANKLGTATVAIFFTCAIHHGLHPFITLLPSVGVDIPIGLALRDAWAWHTVAWDLFGALVAVYYISLRHTYGPLMRGPVLFEDLKEQQRRALEINDNIVQGLTVAYMALDLDDVATSEDALEETLRKTRLIISDLVGESSSRSRLRAGDLVRESPAAIAPSA